MVISYEFMKRAFDEFHKISYDMTTSVKFCLSYDPFNLDFIIFKVGVISLENAMLPQMLL